MVLVLYYVEYVWAHATKTLTKNVLDGGLICGMGKCATSLATSLPPFTQIWFFHHLSSRSCYHTCYHCTGTTSTAYARGATMTPSGGTQTTMPPLPLSLSPHTHCRHCLHLWAQVKLCFFLLFFVSFLTIAETSFPHMPGSQSPHLSTVPFFFFFFRFFSDQCCRDLFSPHARFSNPPPLHHASPLKPRKSRHRHCPIRGHASKVMFISFLFFRSFSDHPSSLTSPHCLAAHKP